MTSATHERPAELLPAGTWTIDRQRSSVEFGIRHMMVSTVRGRFTDFDGAIENDERGPRVRGTVTTASVDTGNGVRDDRVRGADFLAAYAHPEIRFASSHITPVGDGMLRIAGDLTLAGSTRPVELRAKVTPDGAGRLRFEVRGSVRRSAFGIEPKSLLEAGVSDRVDLRLDVHVRREP